MFSEDNGKIKRGAGNAGTVKFKQGGVSVFFL